MLNNFECYQRGNFERINDVHQHITNSSPNKQGGVSTQPTDNSILAKLSKHLRSPLSDDEEDKYEKELTLTTTCYHGMSQKTRTVNCHHKYPLLCKKKPTLLENFSWDVKRAQFSLLNCNRSILQFPQAKWLNLLSGNAIDLDHVFSNICTVSYNTRDIVELGRNIELLHGFSTLVKTSTLLSPTYSARTPSCLCRELGLRMESE